MEPKDSMQLHSKSLAAFLLSVACGMGAFAADSAPVTSGDAARRGDVHADAREQRKPVTEGLSHAGDMRASHAHAVVLPAPTADQVKSQFAHPPKGAPLKIGFGRHVSELDTDAGTAAALRWEPLADGVLVADVKLASTGAAAIRAGLRVASLPDSATVRFKAPGAPDLFDVTGAKINAAIKANADAGDTSDAGRTYWSPELDGEAISVEIELAPGTDPLDVKVAIPTVAHMVTSAAKDYALPADLKSASCELDAMCYTATWGQQMNAVARMLFTPDGVSFFACTGTLLADQDAANNAPYFLSANHCISTQTAASSLVTRWFYRSTSCGSGVAGPYIELAGGATLLYHSQAFDTPYTDTSFMRLNNTPPAGTVFAGWYAGPTPGLFSAITGLHHPGGDLLKISNGQISGYDVCTAPNSNDSFSCNGGSSTVSPSEGFYDVNWNSGITEPGSSGSGIFLSNGLLVGQLYGGTGDCTMPGGDVYGRFDLAYAKALNQWLSPPLTLTVNKSGAGSGTVASTPAAINCGTSCSASFTYGTSVTLNASPAAGSTFNGWSGACSGTGACTVLVNQSQTVSASFGLANGIVSVSTTGAGTVTSSPAGINCSGCSASFTAGTSVTLTAVPAPGYYFSGWAGACSGTGACTVTANGSISVGAIFALKTAPTVAVVPSINPSLVGAAVTFAANVNGGAGTATGSLTISADGAALAGCLNLPLSSGSATCSVSTLKVGTHSLTASYGGDAVYNASTSAVVTQTVSQAGTVQISAPVLFNMGGESMGTSSPPQTLTITNSGASTVSFTGSSVTGPFTQTNNCTSIAPNATCTVTVVFNPAITQGPVNSSVAASGTLTLTSNAANSPYVVSLAGTAEASLVTHYYQSILRRDPDASGKSFWQSQAARMVTDGVDVNETWNAMALQFFAGAEYASLNRDDAGFVTDLYNTFFNRPPDSSGLSYWTGQIAQGTPREVVLVSFLFSNEFSTFTQSIFGTSTVRAEINTVTDFYRGVLGRLPDDSGFAYWLQQFRTAQCQGASAVVAQANNISYAFTTSTEYVNRNRTNAQFVGDMYDTFLRRGGDAAGVQFWLGQLNTGAQSREQVRQSFLGSTEFTNRVNAIVAQGCL